jgi:hypothetical protein
MAMLAEIVTTDDLLATLDRHTLKQPPLIAQRGQTCE